MALPKFRQPRDGPLRWIRNAPRVALALILCGTASFATALFQTGDLSGIPLTTELHVENAGWWPTKGDAPRKLYAGSAACAECHSAIAAAYASAQMAHAATFAARSHALQAHRSLSFQLGSFAERLVTAQGSSVLTISDANSSISRTLGWAFGEGFMGQTYIYEHGGSFYEAHLSFFTAPQALDITPGQPRSASASLQEATGRQMSADDARHCFGCHTTASTVSNAFDPHDSTPGVTCEACHGPGASHVVLMSLGTQGEGPTEIFNPRRLDPVDSVDFCGACHRTWQDVVMSGFVKTGVFNVRFAPYRLENSRCWGKGDARLTCTACHDPHKPLVTDANAYDSACLRCHVLRGAKGIAGHPGAACPVAAVNCVTCHMPKYEPPGLHYKFTDHWIRVVHPGKPYPS
jgi:Cytochrome c554 and c-prime